MIGKPEWFKRRKYGGWGISPQTWQGWVYLALVLLPFIIFQSIPIWDINLRIYVTIGWLVFLLLDVIHIMISLKKDEREYKIEAISERNAAWTMMLVLIIGILYEVFTSALNQEININWFLIIALFGGMIVKTISNLILERKAI